MKTKTTRFTAALRRETARVLVQAHQEKLAGAVTEFLRPYQPALHAWYLRQVGVEADDVATQALLNLPKSWTIHGGTRTVAFFNVPGVSYVQFDIELTPARRALQGMPNRFEWNAVEDTFLSVLNVHNLHKLVELQEAKSRFNKYTKEDEFYTTLSPFHSVERLLETLPDMKPHVELAMKRLGLTADKQPSEQPLVDPSAMATSLGLPV